MGTRVAALVVLVLTVAACDRSSSEPMPSVAPDWLTWEMVARGFDCESQSGPDVAVDPSPVWFDVSTVERWALLDASFVVQEPTSDGFENRYVSVSGSATEIISTSSDDPKQLAVPERRVSSGMELEVDRVVAGPYLADRWP